MCYSSVARTRSCGVLKSRAFCWGADDAGLFANQVARIGAGPVAFAVLDGGVKFVRRRKVVRVQLAHKVQRHLRERALEVTRKVKGHCAANVGSTDELSQPPSLPYGKKTL